MDNIIPMYFTAVIPQPPVCNILLPDPDFGHTIFVAGLQTEIMVLIAGKSIKEQKFILAGALEACDDYLIKSCLKSLLDALPSSEKFSRDE